MRIWMGELFDVWREEAMLREKREWEDFEKYIIYYIKYGMKLF